MDNKIHLWTPFDATAFASGTAQYSSSINVGLYRPNGFFSTQVYLNDADGSMTLEWQASNDNTNFIEAYDEDGNEWPAICTSFAYNGGIGTNGRAVFTIQPPPGKYLRIKATPSAHAITGLTVIVSII